MANDFSVKYQGNSFADWFKTHYGKDYVDGTAYDRGNMSDADWAIGQSLYNAYKTGQNLDSQYKASVGTVNTNYDNSKSDLERYYGTNSAALEAERKRSAQQANMTYELMKKYLPEQIKARGLSGSGVSESTLLSAYSTYANNLGQVNSDYAANKTALDNEYQSGLSELERNKNAELSELELAYGNNKTANETSAGEAVQDIFEGYRTEYKADQEKLEAKATQNFNNAKEAIGLLGTVDYDVMEEYINGFSGLGEETLAQLQQYGKAVVKANIENRRVEGENIDDVTVENQYLNQFKSQGKAFDMDDFEKDGKASDELKAQIATEYNALIANSGASFFDGCTDVHERWKRYTDAIWSGLVTEENKRLLTEALKQVDPDLYKQKAAEGSLFAAVSESATQSATAATATVETLTYEKVKDMIPWWSATRVKTKSEFSPSQLYPTYEDYLKSIYDKFAKY